MNPTTNQVTIYQQTFLRSALIVLLALVMVFITAVAVAKPPADSGGGKDKGGGGDGGDTGGYQPNVRLLCRADLNGDYSRVRPAVANDGTIYVVDTSKTLFAFNPDCSLKWQALDAGSKGVDVGFDGTVFTGTEDWIKAFYPDGSLKWNFTQSPRAFILIDVAVGPDGNVYGVASSGMGIFALDAETGEEIWRTEEVYGRNIVTYTEIEFGPTNDGSDFQLGFSANGHARAVRTSDGSQAFLLDGGLYQPRVSPVDGSWHITNKAYSPDGDLQWAFSSGEIEGFMDPAVGGDGTHYTIGQFGRVYAIDPAGSQRWAAPMQERGNQIDVDPTDSILILNAGGGTAQPAALQAMSAANGRTLWRMEFPLLDRDGDQFVDTNAAFSASGDTVYVITALAGGDRTLMPRSFLNVVSTDPSLPAASTVLRSTDVTITARSRRRSLNFTGTVTVADESGTPISGAMVTATWTRPDGTTESQTAETAGSGQAGFKLSGEGGLYKLTVTNIVKGDQYQFDPDHGVLNAAIVQY